jgi:hypothetical protein
MRNTNKRKKPIKIARITILKLGIAVLFFASLMLSYSSATAQNPVFDISIDQQKLLSGGYPLQQVLQSGGQFWTTPFTQYNAQTKMGDGYGEGANGPRSAQRKIFDPSTPNYPFLRLNGLDSQSCYECHNSIGSDPGYGAGSPLLRKQPGSVGGSAGFNSTAFINPCFPCPLTLFVRSPPHVFGTGYVQTVGDEISSDLYALRTQVRKAAMAKPGVQQSITLIALNDTNQGVSYGTFKTTYKKGAKWSVVNSVNNCPTNPCPPSACAAKPTATALAKSSKAPLSAKPTTDNSDIGAVMVDGFTDDVGQVQGVAFDLIVRPFQWKGISSSIRHFVRDALDFHFSMQAVEKVGSCDCDKDGKTSEVTLGNVSAITSFVGMTRPPQQVIPAGISPATVQRGYEIFTAMTNDAALKAKLSGQMCATCHIPALPIPASNPQFVIDTPVGNPNPNCTNCPSEATASYTSLVSPLASYLQVPVIQRIKAATPGATPAGNNQTYNIPLNSTDVPPANLPRLTQMAPFFLSFNSPPSSGGFYVPFFSDLRTHDMGKFLADLVPQGADVAGVCIPPRLFLTRPLWGVADTGPWLHDGRATSLLDAILMHGDTASGSGSDAAPIIDAFKKLSADDQQAVINFLLSLRLPVEQGSN